MEVEKRKRQRSKIKGYIISIKLFSSLRKQEKLYSNLMEQMYNEKIVGEIRGDSRMLVRTMFKRKEDNLLYYYGQLGRYTIIEGNDWLNFENRERDTVDIPVNKFPNLKDVDYIFIPDAHRFFIKSTQGITINTVVRFLKSAIKKTLSDEEQLDVNLELSTDIIDRIIKAPSIHEITIEITYTNDDTNTATADFIDQQLKRAKASKAVLKFKADTNEDIQVQGTFIEGALELSRTNGSAEAKITNAEGKHETIKTKEHPNIYTISIPSTVTQEEAVADEILTKFRNNE